MACFWCLSGFSSAMLRSVVSREVRSGAFMRLIWLLGREAGPLEGLSLIRFLFDYSKGEFGLPWPEEIEGTISS